MCGVLSANAQLSLKEIRTASDTVLVAFFQSKNVSGPVWNTVFKPTEVNTDNLSLWKLNGQPVTAINKFVTEADAVDYHIYLQVPKLVSGTAYTLETPYGNTNFVFDDKQIFCESIKVNQNGYSALSQVRYANLAIWLGTGGAKPISKDSQPTPCSSNLRGNRSLRGRCNRSDRTHPRAILSIGSICRRCPRAGPTRFP